MDAVNNIPHTIDNDSDFEVENELPSLESIYSRDVYKKLRPKDRKRLEVINGMYMFNSIWINLSFMQFRLEE